jgi:integrase
MSNETIPTFRELAAEVLDQRDEQGVRGIARERSRFRVHIEPSAFIDMPITEIAPRHVRTWLRDMARKDAILPPRRATKKLDRATINRAFSLVSVICTEAVEREIIETNPCAPVKQKKKVDESDTIEKWSYLTPTEQQAIIDCPSVPLAQKLAIRFAVGTGMRFGEQFNLELPDLIVDGDNPRVVVRYSNPHKGKKSPPKSGKRREIPLTGDALVVAKQWLAMLPSFAPSNPHELVFPTERGFRRQQGKPLGRSASIHAVYKAAGIKPRKGLHWHALRHTFASNLVASGVRIEVVQVLMGHSSVVISQRYAHLSQDDVKRALEAVSPPAPATEPVIVPAECMPEALDTVRDLSTLEKEEVSHEWH